MRKETSKSRLLKRRLLAAMLSCLMIVMTICTLTFNSVYNKAANAVETNSAKLADETITSVSDAYYSQMLDTLKSEIKHFCINIGIEATAYQYSFENYDDYTDFICADSYDYFGYTSYAACFIYDGETIKWNPIYNDYFEEKSLDDIVQLFDEEISENYEEYHASDFINLLDMNKNENTGCFCAKGEGYIIAWDKMWCENPFNKEICVGLLWQNTNSIVAPIKEHASQKTDELLLNLDNMFKKYIYIMIASVIGTFLLFALISVIISKKLSDPIVSEHDMLVQVNEMKTTFLSDASHELKTPLAAMSGYAQNAEMELANGENTVLIQEKLKRISSESNRMALMVTQILDATRIEEGRMVLERTPCDIESLVRETIETYFAVLNKNNNRLALRIPVELPKVNADSSRLQRVFVNLISNALKHTKNGTILIKAEEDGNFIKVTVKDTGSGISEEDMPHIWERYYKGKHSETGTGLGLFICRFIIESHGGKIWAESEVGKGTAFMFTLPLK